MNPATCPKRRRPLLLAVFLCTCAGLLLTLLAIEAADGHRISARQGTQDAPLGQASTPGLREAGGLHWLVGWVRDEQGGPIGSALITVAANYLAAPEDVLETHSGFDGGFRLEISRATPMRLEARHPHYAPASRRLPAGWEGEVVLTLAPAAVLGVVVTTSAGDPVGGVEVRVERGRKSEDILTTSASGEAEFSALRGGEYSLGIDHPGFAPYQARVAVQAGSKVRHDAVLQRGGVVSGRVTTADGTPLEGAEVFTSGRTSRPVTTDEGGGYVLRHVAAVPVEVRARLDGVGTTFFGAQFGWRQPVPIYVGEGDEAGGVDLVIGPSAYVVGAVADEGGLPVEGVEVSALVPGAGETRLSAPTDAEGRYRLGPISLLRPSHVSLTFSAKSHEFAPVDMEKLAPGETLDLGTIVAVKRGRLKGHIIASVGLEPEEAWVRCGTAVARVTRGEEFDLYPCGPGPVELLAGATVGGRSYRSATHRLELSPGQVVTGLQLVLEPELVISGWVLQESGDATGTKMVAAVPAENTAELLPLYTLAWVLTDKTGAFRIPNLVSGTYRVGLVENPGGGFRLSAEPTPQLVEAGAEGVLIEVPSRASVRVRGRLLGAHDAPLVDAELVWTQVGDDYPRHDTREYCDLEDGWFICELPSAGRWSLRVSAAGYAPTEFGPIEIPPGDEHDLGELRFQGDGAVTGRILDGSGAPAAYVRVDLVQPEGGGVRSGGYSDSGGAFALPQVAAGEYALVVSSPSHPTTLRAGCRVKRGETTRIEVRLPEPCQARFRILDSGGSPLVGASLIVYDPLLERIPRRKRMALLSGVEGERSSDAQGWVNLSGLAPGRLRARAWAEGCKPTKLDFEVAAGSARVIEIRLEPGQ